MAPNRARQAVVGAMALVLFAACSSPGPSTPARSDSDPAAPAGSGQITPNGKERIRVATGQAASGTGWASPDVRYGERQGPYDVYASPHSDKVIGWWYKGVGSVPVGTRPDDKSFTTATTARGG
jgi:hypothetical protein